MDHHVRRLRPGRLLLLLSATLVLGCPKRPPITRPEEALLPSRQSLPPDDGDPATLRAALAHSLAWLATQPEERVFVFGSRTVTAGREKAAFQELAAFLDTHPDPPTLSRFVEDRFEVLEAAGDPAGHLMVTGYYEPAISASLTSGGGYSVPIYGLPSDLVEVPLEPFAPRFKGEHVAGRVDTSRAPARLVPYDSRVEIEAGSLGKRAPLLAWARDPVDLFFLQVQGSGVLTLPDGSERRIGYAAANGRPYRSIGTLLIEEGAITRESLSMQAERAWLAAHLDQVNRVLDYDSSYVFFRFLSGPALGSLDEPLTPERSIATDWRLFPPAALAFVETTRPVGSYEAPEWKPVTRFVLAQDTGGAIRGAGHCDFFWGRGPEAALAAGMMKQDGRLFFLAPRPVLAPTPSAPPGPSGSGARSPPGRREDAPPSGPGR